jgi:hypothetical protein
MYPAGFTRGAAALLLPAIVVVVLLLGQLLQLAAAAIRPAPAGGNNNGTQHLHLFMHDGYPTAVLIVNGSTAAPVLPGNRRFGDVGLIQLACVSADVITLNERFCCLL